MAADFSFGSQLIINPDTLLPTTGTLGFYAGIGDVTPAAIFDTNATAQANITATAEGFTPPFRANIESGYLYPGTGDYWHEVISTQALRTAAGAADAATAAQASADASATSAATAAAAVASKVSKVTGAYLELSVEYPSGLGTPVRPTASTDYRVTFVIPFGAAAPASVAAGSNAGAQPQDRIERY